MVIIPNEVRDAINKRLDVVLHEHPESEIDRELFYAQCLQYYDETGLIPEIRLVPKNQID